MAEGKLAGVVAVSAIFGTLAGIIISTTLPSHLHSVASVTVRPVLANLASGTPSFHERRSVSRIEAAHSVQNVEEESTPALLKSQKAWNSILFPVAALALGVIAWFKSMQRTDESSADVEFGENWAMAAEAGEVLIQKSAMVPVKDSKGATLGTKELCLKTAGPNSRHVIHKKLVAEFANRRQSNAHTKTRGEVRGGGRKPYKQKGTGNARRGTNTSPLMRKGGVAFGPRNTKNYKQKINKKEGRLAISSLLQNRASLVTIVKDLEDSLDTVSTKRAHEMIEAWKDKEKGENVLLLIDVAGRWPATHPLVLSTNNIPNVRLMSQQMLSVADLLWPNQIFISEKALEGLKARFEVSEEESAKVLESI